MGADENKTTSLHGEWAQRLWQYCVNSEETSTAKMMTYLVTPSYESVRLPTPPGTARLMLHAYLAGWDVLEVAAAFFIEHPTAKYIILTVLSVGRGKQCSRTIEITAWME